MILSIRRFALAVGLCASFSSSAALSEGLAGAYLAGNQANIQNDFDAAARYYSAAIAQDPNNQVLLNNALFAFVAKGEIERGIAIARKIGTEGEQQQLARLVLLADAVKRENYDTAFAIISPDQVTFSPLLDGLMKGWVQLGLGKMTAASAAFDAMQTPDALRLFGQYHKALALALVGDFSGADKILQGDERGNLRLNRGSLIAHAEILSQLDRVPEALEILDAALQGSTDREVSALRDAIARDGAVPFSFINSPREGAAEVFFTLGSALSREESDRYSLVYARLAEYLRPGYTEAILLTAEILQEQSQFDLATKEFAKVPEDDPMFLNAELGRAGALVAAEKDDAAIEVFRGLARSHAAVPTVHMSLGDVLRGQERYDEAREAYDRAIGLIPDPAQNHWFLFYARGISHERQDNWQQAEADFRKALLLSPDQPLVLNYLGYSLVEKGIKMEEAQRMIKSAVRQRPDDGYITDSLGWVLYKIGKYDQAVAPMERAVELTPMDPIINDHLGDVLWKVGRKREAEFQWRRALSFEPEEKEAERIRRKLDVGLDVVLKEEKARQGDGN